MITESQFLEHLQADIRANKITLPTLPEVALKVRDAMENDNVTGKEIADIITTDAALSARLLQVANSPLYAGRVAIESVQMAVTRMGIRMVRQLVVNLAMKQMFQPTSDAMDKRLRDLWKESVGVAAIARALTLQMSHLEPEQALLAGLIHNIGALPILTLAEGIPEYMNDAERLDSLLNNLCPIVGKQILESWHFSDSMIAVPANCYDFSYDGGPQADYVDVVIVARLQTPAVAFANANADWSQIPAFSKLGIEPEISVIEIEGVAEEVEAVEELLLI
jgi:HD-like signal output (HDOD) protein